MCKRKDDYERGKVKRLASNYEVNKALPEDYLMEPLNPYSRIIPLHEKGKKNTLNNRNISPTNENGMGLLYVITKKDRSQKAFIQYAYTTDSGFYIKNVKEYKNDFKGYLKFLSSIDLHLIVINKDDTKFSLPIPIQVLIDNWNPIQDTSNRISFHGKYSTIKLYSLHQNTIEGSVITALINLIK